MTDRITIQGLCLHGYHGVHPEENRLGQKFYIDVDCFLDLGPCAADDDYDKSVCYGALCDLAAEVSASGPFRLIETLGERIASTILERYAAIGEVVVRVRKPSAPIAFSLDHVEITIARKRRYRVGISLGSNLGDKIANVRTALAYLNVEHELEIDRVSRLYRTAPWGKEDQDWFVNACATGWTTLAPVDLLRALKRVELAIGRVPGERWGPRAIDLDLLYANDLEMETALLTLPHPEMFNRAFVLVPLAEIAADHAVLGQRIGTAATRLGHSPDEIAPIIGEPRAAPIRGERGPALELAGRR
jgi:dihydroneopterin aldolase/2-amino-4-hydroxy-6-hydroxymethyldihydropteridine diphosphokinase